MNSQVWFLCDGFGFLTKKKNWIKINLRFWVILKTLKEGTGFMKELVGGSWNGSLVESKYFLKNHGYYSLELVMWSFEELWFMMNAKIHYPDNYRGLFMFLITAPTLGPIDRPSSTFILTLTEGCPSSTVLHPLSS
jgi:hypothetical protein